MRLFASFFILTIRAIRIIIRSEKMTFRELEKILNLNGWYLHHVRGSHYI